MFLIRHEDLSTEGNLHRRFHVAGSTGKEGERERRRGIKVKGGGGGAQGKRSVQ
jgi:hypothetical protein